MKGNCPPMTLANMPELGGSCLCNQHSPVVCSIVRIKSQRVNGLRTKGTPMGAAACPEVTITCKVERCCFGRAISSKPFMSGI